MWISFFKKYLQIKNFGLVIYNYQNCIIFYLHCYAKQKYLFYTKDVQSFHKFLIKTSDTFTGFFMSSCKGRQEKNNSQNFNNISLFSLERIRPHSYLKYITDVNMELGKGNMAF